MRKLLFAVFAFSITIVSCNKELELNPKDEVVTPIEQSNTIIPRTITASLSDILTKTAYTDEGKFTWSADDQIAVYYTKTDDQGVHQGWLAYQVDQLTNENKTATFSLVSGQDAKESLFSDYTPTGVAVYPVSVARPYTSNSNNQEVTSYSGGKPFVTLGASASTSLSNITMTGVKQADDTYQFKTAGSVLKVTVNNLKSKVKSIALVTNDKVNAPLTGDFILSETDGIFAYRFGDNGTYESDWSGDFSDRLSVPVSYSADNQSETIYFNVPVGTYAAGKLSLQIRAEDGEAVTVTTKHIKKSLTTSVNEVLTLPEINLSYPYTVSVKGDASAPKLNITTNYIRFCVLNTSTNDVSKYSTGMKFTNAMSNFDYNLTGATYNNGSANVASLSASGKYYLHYALRGTSGDTGSFTSLDDNEIVEYGTIPFYFVSSSDAAIAGTYKMAYHDAIYPDTLSDNNDDTLTLSVSDDPTKGNFMITQAFGFCNEVSKSTHSSLAAYDFSKFRDGSPIYGFYNPSASNPKLVFSDISKQVFYYDANNHPHFICEYGTDTLRFGFDSNAYNSTTYDMICWGGYIMNCYDNTSSYDLFVQKFAAEKL